MTNPAGAAVAAPSSTARSSAAHSVLIAVLFLATLAASCSLLRRWLPFPEVPVVREKLAHLSQHGDEYDALFIGSSRIYFQVLPTIFDQALREQGVSARSFNAGVAAMVPPEDNYYLEQVLQRPHRRLRWVFLELMPFGAQADTTLEGTGRFTYWHDWPRTQLLTQSCIADCQRLWQENGKSAERYHTLEVWLENMRLFLANFSNIGRGEPLLRSRFELRKKKADLAKKPDHWDGWIFPEKAVPLQGKVRADYEREYAALLDSPERFSAGDSISWEALRLKLEKLTAAGVTPFLVIPPTVSPRRFFPVQRLGNSVAVLDFSDPHEYPDFFVVDHRLDGVHLNYEGSEIFTKVLARKFSEAMRASNREP